MQISKLVSFFWHIYQMWRLFALQRRDSQNVCRPNRQYDGHGDGFFRTVREHSGNRIFCSNITLDTTNKKLTWEHSLSSDIIRSCQFLRTVARNDACKIFVIFFRIIKTPAIMEKARSLKTHVVWFLLSLLECFHIKEIYIKCSENVYKKKYIYT